MINNYCVSVATKVTWTLFNVTFMCLLPTLFLFWRGQDLDKADFLLLSVCAYCTTNGNIPIHNMMRLTKQWCLISELLIFSSSVTVMNESWSQSQSVISVMVPVSFAGLQLRKILQGWSGWWSIDGCVYRHVTNEKHVKCRSSEWKIR